MKDVMSPCAWQSAKTMTAGPLAVKISPLSFTKVLLIPSWDEKYREVIEEGNMYYFRTIEYGPIHLEWGALSLRLSDPGNSATIA